MYTNMGGAAGVGWKQGAGVISRGAQGTEPLC